MLTYFKKRKENMEMAENAVWDYIHICRKADGEIGNCEIIQDINNSFNRMKSLVDKCPKKFRNDMALRLVIAGYA